MESSQPSFFMQLIPLLLLSVSIGGLAHFLAKEKGRNVMLWSVLGMIPFINFFLIWYFVGASNLKHEDKLNEILKRLQGMN